MVIFFIYLFIYLFNYLFIYLFIVFLLSDRKDPLWVNLVRQFKIVSLS